jgi:NADP-dependent 3-hydroxy acid dehydrogenase YdfG
MVETEFSLVRFHGDAEKANEVYNGFTPLYAEDVAETILFMVTRPDHVNIDDVLIMPTAQGSARDVFKGK